MMALWNHWYLYAIYIGVVHTLIGASSLWYGAHDHDILKSVIGAYTLALGIPLTGVGMLMRSRYRKENEDSLGQPPVDR
jgi:hypothetical protein